MSTMNLRLCALSLFVATAVVAQQGTDHEARFGRLVNAGKWSRHFTIAGFTGADGFSPVVYDFAHKRDGSMLAAGMFQWSGRRRITGLAVRQENTWEDATKEWDRKAPDIGFTSVAVRDDDAVALSTNTGPFGRVPGEIWLETHNRVATIGRFNGSVRSMKWFEDKLWVAGYFELADRQVRNLAVWDGTSWSAPPGGAADQAVYQIRVSGESLLFAGDFQQIGGVPARHVAEWTPNGWKAYDVGDGVAATHVYAVDRNQQGDLFAAGAINGGVVRWTGTSWTPVGDGVFMRATRGVVSDFAFHEGHLVITGCFSHVNGAAGQPSAVQADSVARWTGNGWESVADSSEPIASVWFSYRVCGDEPNPFTAWDMTQQRISVDRDHVLFGGMFSGMGGTPSQSIIAFDGDRWERAVRTRDGLSGPAASIALGGPDDSIYIYGSTHAGKATSPSRVFRYAKVTGSHGKWGPVGGPLPEGLECSQIAVDTAGLVHLACNTRATMNELPRAVLLMQSGQAWQQRSLPGVQGTIWDIRKAPDGRIWLAGGTRTGDASGSGFIARVEGGQVLVVESGFNSTVFRIAFSSASAGSTGPAVIAAGAFTQVGQTSAARIARLRSGRWEAIGTGIQTAVLALAASNESVYVSTEQPPTPGSSHLLLGRWDGRQWLELATTENGLPPAQEQTVYSVRDIAAVGRYVIAVGSILPQAGGRNVWMWDGSRLSALAGGVDAISVDSVVHANGELWFGGTIAEAGGAEHEVPSIGVARFAVRQSARR